MFSKDVDSSMRRDHSQNRDVTIIDADYSR